MGSGIHRSSVLMHDEPINVAGTGARAFYQPENLVDYSAGSESGVTFLLDVHGVDGTADSWYLTAKFQRAIDDIAGPGYGQQRWFDLQPEQIAKLIVEGVGWYGGVAPPTVQHNLATNPSLETNSTGWAVNAGTGAATLTRPTDGGKAGSAYYRASWTTAPAANAGGFEGPTFAAAATSVVSEGVYVRPSRAITMRSGLRWLDSGAAVLSTTYGANVTCPAGVWTRVTAPNLTAPASSVNAKLAVFPANNEAWVVGDTLDVDALMYNTGAVLLDYFDGSSAGASWDGTANASASTRTVTIEDPTLGIVARSTDNVAVSPITVARTIRLFGRYVRMWIQPVAVNPSADFAVRCSLISQY